jgi:hypothetical protein
MNKPVAPSTLLIRLTLNEKEYMIIPKDIISSASALVDSIHSLYSDLCYDHNVRPYFPDKAPYYFNYEIISLMTYLSRQLLPSYFELKYGYKLESKEITYARQLLTYYLDWYLNSSHFRGFLKRSFKEPLDIEARVKEYFQVSPSKPDKAWELFGDQMAQYIPNSNSIQQIILRSTAVAECDTILKLVHYALNSYFKVER